MSPRRRIVAAFAVFMTAGLLLVPLSYAGTDNPSAAQAQAQAKDEKPKTAKKPRPKAAKYLPMKRVGDY